MNNETIVAVFDDAARAAAAVRDLQAAQLPQDAITLYVAGPADTAAAEGGMAVSPDRSWTSLFGGDPDQDVSIYERSMAAGSTVLAVQVSHEQVARITALLETHGPVDLDERAASYGLRPVPHPDIAPATLEGALTGPGAAPVQAATNSQPLAASLQLSEERLVVGRRVVGCGGTRVRRFIVETPVERQVTLHDESVVVVRRPINGDPLVDAAAAFTDQVIEMTETREELVVSRTTHLVEEVTLRRQATERVETVRATLRREDVEVGELPTAQVEPGTGTAEPKRLT